MTSPIEIEGAEASTEVDEQAEQKRSAAPEKLEGRSPGQLMWRRFKRDRSGVVSAYIVVFFFLIAALAPLISKLYGKNPYTLYGQDDPTLLNDFNMPAGPNGGITSDFWFGIEPTLGRDVFMQLLYGMRTSLYTALAATVAMVFMGVLIGLVGGYFGGKVDYWLGRLTDFLLAFPQQLFMIAAMPVITAVFVAPDEETPTYIHALAIIGVLWFLGWMGLARLLAVADHPQGTTAQPRHTDPGAGHLHAAQHHSVGRVSLLRRRRLLRTDPRLGPDVRHRVGHLRTGPGLHVLPGCRHGRLRRGVQPPR
jgi:peptide/nickel transport system permease protein